MLTDHHIFSPLDRSGHDIRFSFEVNWNPEDEKTNECKVIKLVCPDGKTSYVHREDLLQFFFAIAQPEDQRKMIPQTIARVHEQTMKLAIKATKDIRKGEEIVMSDIKVAIPCSVVEKIGEVNVERGFSKLPFIGKYLKPK